MNYNHEEARTSQENRPLESSRLMPLKVAAKVLGLTVWGIRQRIWAGQIPVVQFPGGRKQYVDVRDIEKLISAHKRVIN